jgi:hypothetical protein
MMMLLVCNLALSWTLLRVDPMTAKTIIRGWHDLHVARNLPHDFEFFIVQLIECWLILKTGKWQF